MYGGRRREGRRHRDGDRGLELEGREMVREREREGDRGRAAEEGLQREGE